MKMLKTKRKPCVHFCDKKIYQDRDRKFNNVLLTLTGK